MDKVYFKTSLRGLFSILLLLSFSPFVSAQFTAGRIVVVQTTGATSKAGSAVTLNEYQLDGTSGTSVAIPATGTTPLQMAAGSGGSEGFLTRSPDGTFLVLAGYSTTATITDITASTSASAPRVIFKVDAAGNYSQVATSSTFYNANDIRGAITDGTNYWAAGASNATDGINYYGPGTQVALGVGAKAYGLQIFNNQIYFSTQKVVAGVTPSFGIYSLGTGTPTSGTITPTLLFSTGSATPVDFSINPVGDVCYVAINANTPTGGIQKWVNTSGTWTLAYTLSTGVTNIGAYGLAVDYSGTDAVLYATTFEANTTGNRIIKITDTGAASAATTLVTGAANTFFHGIAFSPTCPLPTQPANFTASSALVTPGQSAITYTVPNDAAVTYVWNYSGNGATITGTGNSVTVDFSTTATAGTLSVTATTACGSSTARTIDVTIAGAMRITEFMYKAAGSSGTGEYVEFTNIGGTPVDMTGWSFDDNSRTAGSFSLSAFGIVQPGESVIVTELSAAAFRTNWNLCAGTKVIGGNNQGLGNGDEINLYDASNNQVDRLTYLSTGSVITVGVSGWVSAAGVGINDITKWTLSAVGDAEDSYTSANTDIGSPGMSTRATVAFDPCFVANGAPTIVLDVTTTTNFIDGAVTVAPASPFAMSGAISDPTDPGMIAGVDFTIADAETAVNSLTVTVTSSNHTVVPVANLVLTGSGASRNLKITPAAVGYAVITITVSDGTNNTNFIINYAASAASVTPAATLWHTGMSDGSEAISIDENYYIAIDDELNVLNVYSKSTSGLPLVSYDYGSNLALDPAKPEVDLEAGTQSRSINNRMYWLGSMSNTKAPFNPAPNRNRIFATNVSGTGAATTFTFAGYYNDLRAQLITWGDAHGYNFTASAAAGIDSKSASGFAAEGMVFGPDNSTLYIGLRAPLVPVTTRDKAVIAPILNFENWFNNGAPASAPTFGAPIELDLGGRGIRSIIRMSNGVFIIVAGNPAGIVDNSIFKWSGRAADAPVLVNTSVNNVLNMEGVIEVSLSQLQVISDMGDDDLYNDGSEAKDFNDLILRKFRSDVLSTLDLCINTTSTTTETSCTDYVWNGTTYNSTGTYTIHLDNEFGCDSAATLDLTVNTCTPVLNADAASQIQLIPNPNAGQVLVKFPFQFQVTTLSIYGTTGDKIRELAVAPSVSESALELQDLKPGMYLIVLKDAQGNQLTQRMIKE